MKVFNVSGQPIGKTSAHTAVTVAAERVGLGLYDLRKDGSGVRFQLRLRKRREDGSLMYQRVSSARWNKGKDGKQRRIAAVCWHGHKAFFDELFKLCPEAKVRTAVCNYDGVEDYEAKVDTRQTSTGNYYGFGLDDLKHCTCEDYKEER